MEKTIAYTLLNFTDVIKAVLDGRNATRLEWGDESVYVFMRAGYLHIHNDRGDHVLTVGEGDMRADDWYIL